MLGSLQVQKAHDAWNQASDKVEGCLPSLGKVVRGLWDTQECQLLKIRPHWDTGGAVG